MSLLSLSMNFTLWWCRDLTHFFEDEHTFRFMSRCCIITRKKKLYYDYSFINHKYSHYLEKVVGLIQVYDAGAASKQLHILLESILSETIMQSGPKICYHWQQYNLYSPWKIITRLCNIQGKDYLLHLRLSHEF